MGELYYAVEPHQKLGEKIREGKGGVTFVRGGRRQGVPLDPGQIYWSNLLVKP